jgi:hypothetical protein
LVLEEVKPATDLGAAELEAIEPPDSSAIANWQHDDWQHDDWQQKPSRDWD